MEGKFSEIYKRVIYNHITDIQGISLDIIFVSINTHSSSGGAGGPLLETHSLLTCRQQAVEMKK